MERYECIGAKNTEELVERVNLYYENHGYEVCGICYNPDIKMYTAFMVKK